MDANISGPCRQCRASQDEDNILRHDLCPRDTSTTSHRLEIRCLGPDDAAWDKRMFHLVCEEGAESSWARSAKQQNCDRLSNTVASQIAFSVSVVCFDKLNNLNLTSILSKHISREHCATPTEKSLKDGRTQYGMFQAELRPVLC